MDLFSDVLGGMMARVRSNRRVASAIALLTIAAMLTGCDSFPQEVKKASISDPTEVDIECTDPDACIEIAFVAVDSVDRPAAIWFALRNRTNQPCQMTRARLVCQTVANSDMDRENVDGVVVPPQSYKFCTFPLEADNLPNNSELWIDYSQQRKIGTARKRVGTSSLLENISFSEDLTMVTVHAKLPKSTPVDVTSEFLVNGLPATVVSAATFSTASGEMHFVAQANTPCRLRHGENVLVELHYDQSHRFGWGKKASLPFTVYPTQYAFPLRVAASHHTSEGLRVTLYNESNEDKPELAIDSVSVDGVDVTARCVLPDAPLPPDRGQFDRDCRDILIPADVASNDAHTLELSYHLLAPTRARSRKPDGIERVLRVGLRRGLELPIGLLGGPTLPEMICLHHGGLQPDDDAVSTASRAAEAASIAPEIPTYVETSEGRPLGECAALARRCDVLVAGASHLLRAESEDPIGDVLNYFSALGRFRTPFIASISKDFGCPSFSTRDVHWMVLAALSEGSQGVLLPPTGPPGSTNEWGFGAQDVLHLKEVLAGSNKIPLECISNQPGLHVSCLSQNPDQLVVIVLNCWCTRTSRQGDVPFFAAPRSAVQLVLTTGPRWQSANAWDVGTGEAMSPQAVDASRIKLNLPPFRIGRMLILTREEASHENRPHQRRTIAALAEKPVDTKELALVPVNSPFVRLNRVGAGKSTSFQVRVRNDSGEAINVVVRDATHSTPFQAWAFRAEPCAIGPGQEGVLRGTAVAPLATGRAVARLWVGPEGTEDKDGFYLFLDGESFYETAVQPKVVEFGAIPLKASAHWKRVEMNAHISGAVISRVSCEDTPIEVRIASDGQSFAFRPTSASEGAFHSHAFVEISHDRDVISKLPVAFSGTVVASVRAEPAMIVLTAPQTTVHRELRLVHAGAQPMTIQNLKVTDSRLVIRHSTQGQLPIHRLSLDIKASEKATGFHAAVKGTAMLPDAQLHDFTIPVRILGIASERVVPLQANSAPERGVLQRVDHVVSRFRDFDLPESTPNWLLFHRLLMFGEDANESPRFHKLYLSIARPNGARDEPFVLTRGRPFPRRTGALFSQEHHRDQFLQYLSMARMPLASPLQIEGAEYTLDEILSRAQFESRAEGELCWTAAAFAHYLPAGSSWKNKYAETVSLGTLYRAILDNPNPVCGGSHELCSIACVLSRPDHRRDPELSRIWPTLERRIVDATNNLREQQRADGSFALPTSMHNDPRMLRADEVPHSVGIHYTGHTLEWMAVALPARDLQDPWIVRAVEYLLLALESEYPDAHNLAPFSTDDRSMSYGFVAHAVSGLTRWRSKVEYLLDPLHDKEGRP